MPKISIIVPVYKVEKYIEQCIDSILNQTFKDFELILVDDGSPDKCPEICDKYALKDERIKVIHKSNGGLSSARNAGIEIATGDYIGFVDSDDFVHHKMYETLYNYALEYNADISICNYIKFTSEDKPYNIADIDKNIKIEEYDNISALKQLYKDNIGVFWGPWQKIYKRNLFEKIKFEEGRIHEDRLICHRLLYESKKTIYIPKIFYYYRVRNGSISTSTFKPKYYSDLIYAYRDCMILFTSENLDLKYKAQEEYLYILFKYSKNIQRESKVYFKKTRKDFKKVLNLLIDSKSHSIKEKISWIMFIYTPFLYEIVINKNKEEFNNA